MVITSICFIILTTTLAMFLESILTILGLFAAISGIVFYFIIPIAFWIKYPKVKSDNIHLDHLEPGVVVVDPIIVGVLTMLAPSVNEDTVKRIRTSSQMIFGSIKDYVDNN